MPKKHLNNIDLGQNQLINSVFEVGATPSSATAGQFYYNVNENVPYYNNGIDWVLFDKPVKKTWTWGATSKNNTTTDRFLAKYDREFTNNSPYIVFFNARIVAISLSTKANETWIGEVYVNGISSLTLSVTTAKKAFNSSVNLTLNAGDEISFYCNGTNINSPSMEILIEEL